MSVSKFIRDDRLYVSMSEYESLISKYFSAVNALKSACELLNGRAHFITHHGVPMKMPERSELVVRKFLEKEDGE